MSYTLSIVLSTAVIAFIFYWLSYNFSKNEKQSPMSILMFFLGSFFIYINLALNSIIARDEGATGIQGILETITMIWMWIVILLLVYFVVRFMFNLITMFREKNEAGEKFFW